MWTLSHDFQSQNQVLFLEMLMNEYCFTKYRESKLQWNHDVTMFKVWKPRCNVTNVTKSLRVWTDRAAAAAAAARSYNVVNGDAWEWVWDPFQASWVASPLTSIGAAAAAARSVHTLTEWLTHISYFRITDLYLLFFHSLMSYPLSHFLLFYDNFLC